jgi:hypothetical protein
VIVAHRVLKRAFMRTTLLATLLSLSFAVPALAQEAPSSATITVTIEGSLGRDLAAPRPPAPALPSPPVVVLERAAGALPATPAAYQLDAAAVRPSEGPAVYVPPAVSEGPPRYRRRVGLIVGGAVMLAGAWALNIGGTAFALLMPTYNAHRDELMASAFVPIIGPLAQIAFRDDDWQIPIFAVASAIQLTGLVLAITGTVSRVRVEEPERQLAVLPYAGPGGGGVTLLGSF